MDDLRLGRAAALRWIRDYMAETIKNHLEDWTAEEITENIIDASVDLQEVAEGPAGAEWLITDCAMAPTGYAIKQL